MQRIPCWIENYQANGHKTTTRLAHDDGATMRGFVYILSNESMPDLVKIGMTTRSPEKRAKEISSVTGVPIPYVVAYQERVVDCHLAEREIHRRLDYCRVNRDREFFEISIPDAKKVVQEVARECGRIPFYWPFGQSNRPIPIVYRRRTGDNMQGAAESGDGGLFDYFWAIYVFVFVFLRYMLATARKGMAFLASIVSAVIYWIASVKDDVLDDNRDTNAIIIISKLLSFIALAGTLILVCRYFVNRLM